MAFSDVTSSVSSAGTGTSYFFRSSYTCSIGTMMASISASFSLMSCWIAITDRTSSRSSTGLLSHFVVSLTYVTSSSSFSLPCAWRFAANCVFHSAAVFRSSALSGAVSRLSAPMLCVGEKVSTRRSMSMYFLISPSNCSRVGFVFTKSAYTSARYGSRYRKSYSWYVAMCASTSFRNPCTLPVSSSTSLTISTSLAISS